MPGPSIMRLTSKVRRENIVLQILRSHFGSGKFAPRDVDAILQNPTLVPDWVRTQWAMWDRLDMYPVDLPAAQRSCKHCHRQTNSCMAKQCGGCGHTLTPWEERKKYLANLSWRPVSKRQCANVRRSMEAHGHLERLSEHEYLLKQHQTLQELERWQEAHKDAQNNRQVRHEHRAYEILLAIMEMLPHMARHSINTGAQMMYPFDDIDPAAFFQRIEELRAEFREKSKGSANPA